MFFPEKIILVAMTEDRLIGRGNSLPWHLPEELRLFRRLTTGHAVIMGRRTFEAIGRPLPERRNLVLSRTLTEVPEIEVCRSLNEALARAADSEKIFLAGGRRLFAEALAVADKLRISWVEGEYAGDVYFPDFELADWEPVEELEGDRFRHIEYRRLERKS